MKNIFKLMCVLLILSANTAMAQSNVYANIQSDNNVNVTWDAQCIIEWAGGKESWDGKFYKVKYKKVGSLSWSSPIYTDNTNQIYDGSEFDVGETYKVRVRYYGKKPNCRGMVRSRLIGTEVFRYEPKDVVTPPQGDLTEYVRINNISFNKCIYPYATGGLSTLRMHNWSCWDDPTMAFEILSVSPSGPIDAVKLKSIATGLCIKPINNLNYEKVTSGNCAHDNTNFEIQDMGSDNFRLKSLLNNMCLYGSPDNGGNIRQFGCWNNPDMLFEFQEY